MGAMVGSKHEWPSGQTAQSSESLAQSSEGIDALQYVPGLQSVGQSVAAAPGKANTASRSTTDKQNAGGILTRARLGRSSRIKKEKQRSWSTGWK